jgi:hypothetical protein
MIPPLFLMGGVLAAMVVLGYFDWVIGGRVVSFVLLLGFLIGARTALWFMSETAENDWQSLIGAAPWAILAGCFLAVNPGLPSGVLPKTFIALTLGTTALAGFVVAGNGLLQYADSQNQLELSKIENEDRYQREHAEEFQALGPDAPLWNYFSYMYISDEDLRRQCRAIMARRPDLNERLIEYLGNPVLSTSVRNYIADVAENPSPELSPAFARYSQTVLQSYREMLQNQTSLSDRSRQDATVLLTAAARLHKNGGNLQPQIAAWRDFLRAFKDSEDLVRKADEILHTTAP